MGIFERLKAHLENKKRQVVTYDGDNAFIRLNHLQKSVPDKDGKYYLTHTSGYVYELPKDMSVDVAMYVISFLQDKISHDLHVGSKDVKTMTELNHLLNRFYFKKLDEKAINKKDIVDLVICSEGFMQFPNQDSIAIEDMYWKHDNIAQNLIENVYKVRNEEIDLKPLTKFESDFTYGTNTIVYPKQEPKTM